MDDDYFGEGEAEVAVQQPAYNPPQQEEVQEEPQQDEQPVLAMPSEPSTGLDFNSYASTEPAAMAYGGDNGDNEFNDFEEDEMTRRIREQQERIQKELRQKSQKEYDEKNARKAEGRKQLEDFLSRKDSEKDERAADNLKKEQSLREQLAKLNEAAGWKKVISNVNLKQGEYKGKKEINRMRESILHKREDDA